MKGCITMTPIVATPSGAPTDVVLNGVCATRFERVRDVLAANLASGADIGASAAVYLDGEPVVDLWGGFIDEARTQPWQRDTIINNFSTTKTMTALCMLILVDRGEIDVDAPVARYWPEFAQNGKSHVLVKHVLAHSSGLPGWTERLTFEDLCDIEKSTALLERQAPWWEPGTATGYHAISFGQLLGGLVRRVTGKSLGRFFADDVAGPLGGDYHIGTGPEYDSRVAPMIAASPLLVPSGQNTVNDRVMFNPYITPALSGSILWRRAELGGSSGHGNARSVAAIQSVLSNGGEARGVRLLSRAGCERALEMQSDSTDLVCGYPLRWGLGYGLESPMLNRFYDNCFAGRRIAFWGGSGGSTVFNDFDGRMTVAYVMNRHLEHGGIDARGIAIVRAAYEGLKS
jgi:CubicO group peptidase (beta-lactamase class C family)